MGKVSVKRSLNKRRKNGGCGMWKSVGIPFMYKHHKDKLSEKEKNWYEENIINN